MNEETKAYDRAKQLSQGDKTSGLSKNSSTDCLLP